MFCYLEYEPAKSVMSKRWPTSTQPFLFQTSCLIIYFMETLRHNNNDLIVFASVLNLWDSFCILQNVLSTSVCYSVERNECVETVGSLCITYPFISSQRHKAAIRHMFLISTILPNLFQFNRYFCAKTIHHTLFLNVLFGV